MAFRGRKFKMFGAFKSKAAARRRERQHEGSFILPRTIKGKRRYIVMKGKNK